MDLVLAHIKPLASKGEKNQLRWYLQQHGGFHVCKFDIQFYPSFYNNNFFTNAFSTVVVDVAPDMCARFKNIIFTPPRTFQYLENLTHGTFETFGYPIPREPGTRNSLCMLMKVHIPSSKLTGACDVIPGPESSIKLKFKHSP